MWIASYDKDSSLARNKSLCGVVGMMRQTHTANEDLTKVFIRLARAWPKHSGSNYYPIWDKEQRHIIPERQWCICTHSQGFASGNQGILRRELAVFVIDYLEKESCPQQKIC